MGKYVFGRVKTRVRGGESCTHRVNGVDKKRLRLYPIVQCTTICTTGRWDGIVTCRRESIRVETHWIVGIVKLVRSHANRMSFMMRHNVVAVVDVVVYLVGRID